MKYRAIQKIKKGERVFMPGEFIDDDFDKDEIKELINTGFAVLKIVVEKKPKKSKKVKNAENS